MFDLRISATRPARRSPLHFIRFKQWSLAAGKAPSTLLTDSEPSFLCLLEPISATYLEPLRA
jgi:hypothetical protein